MCAFTKFSKSYLNPSKAFLPPSPATSSYSFNIHDTTSSLSGWRRTREGKINTQKRRNLRKMYENCWVHLKFISFNRREHLKEETKAPPCHHPQFSRKIIWLYYCTLPEIASGIWHRYMNRCRRWRGKWKKSKRGGHIRRYNNMGSCVSFLNNKVEEKRKM